MNTQAFNESGRGSKLTRQSVGRVPAGLPSLPRRPRCPPVPLAYAPCRARRLGRALPAAAGEPAEPPAQYRAAADAGGRAGWGAPHKAAAAGAARRLGPVKQLSQQGGHVGGAVLLVLGVVVCRVRAVRGAGKVDDRGMAPGLQVACMRVRLCPATSPSVPLPV